MNWLAKMDYTNAEASYRAGPEWFATIPQNEPAIRDNEEADG